MLATTRSSLFQEQIESSAEVLLYALLPIWMQGHIQPWHELIFGEGHLASRTVRKIVFEKFPHFHGSSHALLRIGQQLGNIRWYLQQEEIGAASFELQLLIRKLAPVIPLKE